MRILNYDPMNARVGIMLLDVIEGERERKRGEIQRRGKWREGKKGETSFLLVEVSPPGGCLDTSEGYLYNPIFEPVPRW